LGQCVGVDVGTELRKIFRVSVLGDPIKAINYEFIFLRVRVYNDQEIQHSLHRR